MLDTGLASLCDAIKTSESLRELHLESCGVTAKGCQLLAEALTSNQSVAALYLNSNVVGDDGCESLADMLMVNTSLQTLYLNMCCVNRRGLHRLLVVISHDNFVLRTLGACYNNIQLNNDDLVQDGFEAVDVRNALKIATESNTDRKILTWGKLIA